MTSEDMARRMHDVITQTAKARVRPESDDVYRWTAQGREVQLPCVSDSEAVVLLMERPGDESRVKNVHRMICDRADDDDIQRVAEYLNAEE